MRVREDLEGLPILTLMTFAYRSVIVLLTFISALLVMNLTVGNVSLNIFRLDSDNRASVLVSSVISALIILKFVTRKDRFKFKVIELPKVYKEINCAGTSKIYFIRSNGNKGYVEVSKRLFDKVKVSDTCYFVIDAPRWSFDEGENSQVEAKMLLNTKAVEKYIEKRCKSK